MKMRRIYPAESLEITKSEENTCVNMGWWKLQRTGV
jgi:hypothetical protein